MNSLQKGALAVGLIVFCLPLVFPVWQITYSNHAGLDRWTVDKITGKPVQEQLWEQKSTQSETKRALFCHIPADRDLKTHELTRDITDDMKGKTEPVENPWQLASLLSATVRYDRMIMESVVVALVTVCVTVCAGLGRRKRTGE